MVWELVVPGRALVVGGGSGVGQRLGCHTRYRSGRTGRPAAGQSSRCIWGEHHNIPYITYDNSTQDRQNTPHMIGIKLEMKPLYMCGGLGKAVRLTKNCFKFYLRNGNIHCLHVLYCLLYSNIPTRSKVTGI